MCELGLDHTDLFGVTFNSCEDFQYGFLAIICGKDILLCMGLVSLSVFFFVFT